MTIRRMFVWSAVVAIALALPSADAAAQWTAEKPGSGNITVLSHLPLGPRLSVSDIDLEQELDRPYAYVGRMVYGVEGDKGIDIIDLHDPTNPKRIYTWRIEDQDLHLGTGGMDVKHFKWNGRYYVVQSLQFGQGGPDPDLGGVVLDVTGLPDPSTVKEVARIRSPDTPGGFHNIFVYKHSNGAGAAVRHRVRPFRARLRSGSTSSKVSSTTRSSPRSRCRTRRASAAATTTSTPGIIPTAVRGSFLRGRHGRLLRLQHHRFGRARAARDAHRHQRRPARAYVHADAGRTLRRSGDRVPVRAAPNLRPGASVRK